MLYIDNTTTNIRIPSHYPKAGTDYTLVLKGMANIEYQYELTDTMQSSLYYVFELAEPIEIPVGTYNYTLLKDDEVKSIGLLQYGSFKDNEEEPTIKYYQRQTERKYYDRNKQYNDTEIISD